MEESISEFQQYLHHTRHKPLETNIQKSNEVQNNRMPNDATSFDKLQSTDINRKARVCLPMQFSRHYIISKQRPIFILSRNPNSRVVNTRSCLGNKMQRTKLNSSMKLYRVNRGDATTIIPIGVKSVAEMSDKHNHKRTLSKVCQMKSSSAQTDYVGKSDAIVVDVGKDDEKCVMKNIYSQQSFE